MFSKVANMMPCLQICLHAATLSAFLQIDCPPALKCCVLNDDSIDLESNVRHLLSQSLPMTACFV